jgi:phospholipid/cholesterol/gamma-HCH transport system substrate-binding protein
VLATQRASGSAIKSFAGDLADLSDTLRTSDGDLRKVFDNGIVASQELDRLVRTNRAAISALLANLLTTGQVTVARLAGLEQILVTYPTNVSGGYTVVPGDGTSHFGLVLNASDPPVCTKGYEGTRQRTPQDTSAAPVNAGARCTEPRGSETSVRGAQHAPGPRSGSARAVPGFAGPGAAGGAPAARTAGSAPAAPPAPAGSYLTGYDRFSGLALGPGGTPLRTGARGGQARTFGEDSWQWLLLGPLGR